MLRRIWSKHDASIVLAGIVALVSFVIGGAAYVLNTYKVDDEIGCAAEVVSLSSPVNQALVEDAIEMLIEAGVVSSQEAAAEALLDAQYIFDPDEDGQLEYWLVFEGPMAAEFNFSCPLNVEGFPLDIEFEGVRGL